MWRFTLFCLLLIGGLCMGLAATRLIGFEVGSLSHSGFDRCVLPCYAGIMPGRTSVSEARAALARLTGMRGTEVAFQSGKWVYSTPTYQVLLDTDMQHVLRLDLDSIQEPALISLGDVILSLGAPSLLYSLPRGGDHYEVFLNYSTANYGVYFLFHVSGPLSPELRADAVQIYTLDDSLSVPLFPMRQGAAWRGFTMVKPPN